MILHILLILFCIHFSSSAHAQEVAPGLVYEMFKHPSGTKIHCLSIDPAQNDIALVNSPIDTVSHSTTSELVGRHGGCAGISGSVLPTTLIPRGTCKIDSHWQSVNSEPKVAFGWKKDGSAFIIHPIFPTITLEIQGRSFPVNLLNSPGSKSLVAVYNRRFGATTLTPRNITEIIVAEGRVKNVYSGSGSENSPIPPDGFVCSFNRSTEDNRSNEELTLFTDQEDIIEAPASCTVTTTPELWDGMDFIISGTSLEESNPSLDRSPHTAIGINGDRTLIKFFLVEKPGITEADLAIFIKEQGCLQSLEISNTSSSTMVIGRSVYSSRESFLADSSRAAGAFSPVESQVLSALVIKPRRS